MDSVVPAGNGRGRGFSGRFDRTAARPLSASWLPSGEGKRRVISRRHPLAVRLNLGGWIAYWSDLRLRLYGWRDPAIRSTAALAAAASFALFDATSWALMVPGAARARVCMVQGGWKGERHMATRRIHMLNRL
jgi:hypothetical protein